MKHIPTDSFLDRARGVSARRQDYERQRWQAQTRLAPATARYVGKKTSQSRYHPVIVRVAREHGLDPAWIMGKRRTKPIAEARQHAMFLLRKAGLSLPRIGQIMHRDHSTVLHGIRAHAQRNGLEAPR